jgi:hypothetical protein
MVRHIFITTIKAGVSDDVVNELIDNMRAMKDKVREIMNMKVGINTGWLGMDNAVTMTVDLKTKKHLIH